MKHEFTIKKGKGITVYSLGESDSGVTTSSSVGSGSVVSSLGGMQRRPTDSIFAQEAKKDETPKPRNFVAKNAKMGGAGKMKDKSKTIPRHEKHKKPVAEGSREMTGSARDQFISTMTPRVNHDALMQKVAKVVNSPEFNSDTILKIVDAGDTITHPVGQYIQKEFDELQYDLGRQYEDYPEQVAEKLLSMLKDRTNQGVAEGAPELLKKEMPLHRHAEKLLAQNGVSKDDPDYHHHLGNTIKHLRQFGNIDLINKQGVAALAKAGRDGAGEEKLDKIRDKHDKYNEGFNGEYDDEAGMAQSNLITSARAVIGLLKTIDDRDNLPEWAQEKIAKAEMMLVGVWDYLQSQKAQGINPQQDMEEGLGKMRGNPGAYDADVRASQSGMNRRPHDHRGLGQELGHETNNYAVAIDGKTWKVFADKRQADNIARSLQAKGKNATVQLTGHDPSESIEERTEVKDKSGKVVSWKDETPWRKAEKNKQGQPKDPRGTVTNLSAKARRETEKNVEEDDSALQAFLSKGGKVDKLPYKEPKTKDKANWGSKHIGTGKGGKAQNVSGKGANTRTGNKPVVSVEDAYMMELAGMMAEKLNPGDPTDVWVQDFQKADPNKYHQFKNKNPAKKAQMAVAAHYAANEPSKKK